MKITKMETFKDVETKTRMKAYWNPKCLYTVEREDGGYYSPGKIYKWSDVPRFLNCYSVPQVLVWISHMQHRYNDNYKVIVKEYQIPEASTTITYE